MENTDNILVSFIVPAYNTGKYLSRCIESILQQTFLLDSMEIIIINDGSTDNTLKIAQKFAKKHSFIQVISQKNQGVSVAKNVGLEMARGKYIWFIDSDDCLNGNLNLDLNSIKNQPIDLIKGKFLHFFENLNSFYVESPAYQGFPYITTPWDIPTVNMSAEALLGDMCGRSTIPVLPRFLIRRELLLEHNIRFQPHLTAGEDTLFFVQMMLVAKNTIEVNHIFYIYHRHDSGTASSTFNLKYIFSLFDVIRQLDEMLRQNEQNGTIPVRTLTHNCIYNIIQLQISLFKDAFDEFKWDDETFNQFDQFTRQFNLPMNFLERVQQYNNFHYTELYQAEGNS